MAYETMEVRKLTGGCGAEVLGVDVKAMSNRAAEVAGSNLWSRSSWLMRSCSLRIRSPRINARQSSHPLVN
jgi:hypothetical protein